MGFRREPDSDHSGCPYKIIRVRPGPGLRGVFISDEHEGADLHYFARASRLHDEDDCEYCAAGNDFRWYGYVYVRLDGLSSIQIMEFTPRCWPTIEAHYKTTGKLRGYHFHLRRLRSETNSPCSIEISERMERPASLPDPQPLRGILENLWGVVAKRVKDPGDNRIRKNTIERLKFTVSNEDRRNSAKKGS